MFKVVLWDIDGTLLNFLEAEKNAIRACFSRFGLGVCTDEMLKVYSAINRTYWQRLEQGQMTKPQILVGRFRDFFEKYHLNTDCAEEFNIQYQLALGDTVCFNPNGMETILALKGKVLQCAVTNGTAVAQKKKLALSGLDQLFDEIFISDEIGFEKPHPGFFEAVWQKIGSYDPDEVLIVGDSLTSDIQGGNNVGIRCCWYNPNGLACPENLRVDFEITDLAQVRSICEGTCL